MDKTEVIEKLKRYKSLVEKHFDLYKMMLYGSYAGGAQTEESDIDVALILNNVEGNYFDYVPKLWKLRRAIDTKIEPVIFKYGKDDPSGFYEEIMKKGIEI